VIDGRAESPAAAAKITRAELPAAAANYRRKNCLLLLPQTALQFSRLSSSRFKLKPLYLRNVGRVAVEIQRKPDLHPLKIDVPRAEQHDSERTLVAVSLRPDNNHNLIADEYGQRSSAPKAILESSSSRQQAKQCRQIVKVLNASSPPRNRAKRRQFGEGREGRRARLDGPDEALQPR